MKPPRTVVLQMSRLGDILQTTPVLRRLRRASPDHEIHLVVADSFSAVPVPARLFDRQHVFPEARLRKMLAASPHDWSEPLALLREFVSDLSREPFDLAVNLTVDDWAGLLMSQLPARRAVGLVTNARRRRSICGDWMTYFWATARSRPIRPFNLVDLYTWAAGAPCDDESLEMAIADDAHARMGTWLGEQGAGTKPLVALQLGASEDIRQWSAERFAAMVDGVPPALADFVLVGTANEQPLAARFLAASKRGAFVAVGRTSLQELGALLERCRLLVTNDTGTMHVATAVGTPVVEITFGPAFVHETGPYGAGHLILEPTVPCFPCTTGSECQHRSCADFLDPREVTGVVCHALTGEGAPPTIALGRLLKSRRATSGRVEYVAVDAARVTLGDTWRSLSAALWEASLKVPPPTGARGVVTGEPLARLRDADRSDVAATIETLEQAASAAAAAERIVRRLPGADRREQPRLADEAHGHLQRLLALGEVDPVCRTIAGFARVEIESVRAVDLRSVASAQATAYAGASVRARRMARLAGDWLADDIGPQTLPAADDDPVT
jgi:ADP-heptose:LPS heptosyltransferase